MQIGFIGLGMMGKPMALNLRAAGFSLIVHDVVAGRVAELARQGATVALSPSEVAEQSDIVLTALPTVATVEEVYLGPGGLVESAREGQILVDHSTVSPTLSRAIAHAARERGAHFLDAPMSGGPEGARAATLTVMVGGDELAFGRAQPVLRALAKNVYYCGPSGAGTVVKLVNQLLVGAHMAAAAEAVVFGVKAGVDARVLLDVIGTSYGASAMFNRNTRLAIDRKFEPDTSIRLMLKDFDIIRELGAELDVRLSLTSLVEQLLIEARALGLQDNDTSAMVIPLERLAGIEVGP
jgi:3-hydroxyisobutyrate dehydrogenase-like beta-hydroxyacid dehydrogenase